MNEWMMFFETLDVSENETCCVILKFSVLTTFKNKTASVSWQFDAGI